MDYMEKNKKWNIDNICHTAKGQRQETGGDSRHFYVEVCESG